MVRCSDVQSKTFLWTGNSSHFKKWLEGFNSLGMRINPLMLIFKTFNCIESQILITCLKTDWTCKERIWEK